MGSTGARNIEISACPSNTPPPPKKFKTSTLAMVPSGEGMVNLAPVVGLTKGQKFCLNKLRFTGLGADSLLPMTVMSDAFVPDAFNSSNVSVKASHDANVTIAGLTLQADVILSVAADGTVGADRENVDATAGAQAFVSKKVDGDRIVFVPKQ